MFILPNFLRTGAGKSSLLTSIMRLRELCTGHIFIDDIDLATIDLDILRGSVSVIPQDPVLFQVEISSKKKSS